MALNVCFQVSNWFINARVRLWKPMVEEMYQQELKEAECAEEREMNQSNNNSNSGHQAQTPTTASGAATTSTATTAPPPPTTTTTTPPPPTTTTATATTPTGKRSDINAVESDPSLVVMNRQGFSESQAKQQCSTASTNTIMAPQAAIISTASEAAPPVPHQGFDSGLPPHRSMATDDMCRHGSYVAGADYGTASASADIGSTLIRFGTTAGDVSLTLGLRHAGNMPEKTPFSVRDFGGI